MERRAREVNSEVKIICYFEVIVQDLVLACFHLFIHF